MQDPVRPSARSLGGRIMETKTTAGRGVFGNPAYSGAYRTAETEPAAP